MAENRQLSTNTNTVTFTLTSNDSNREIHTSEDFWKKILENYHYDDTLSRARANVLSVQFENFVNANPKLNINKNSVDAIKKLLTDTLFAFNKTDMVSIVNFFKALNKRNNTILISVSFNKAQITNRIFSIFSLAF